MFKRSIAILLLFITTGPAVFSQQKNDPPNIVLLFIDDMAFGDVGFNNSAITYTPHLDRLAKSGTVFSHFYVSEAVCTASRSSLLTGCYAKRIGMGGALDHNARVGLHPSEITIADMLQARGYKTAAIGKWHLGFQPPFLPTRQGFDEFFGIPYSGDMWPYHPERPNHYPPLPLYENEKMVDTVKEQSWFTAAFTKKATDFIERNKNSPFFLYLAHPLPHVPLFVSEKFKNSTGKGLYADVIHELDASIGELWKAIQRAGVENNTLLIVTSDNGPWLSYGNHSGSTAGLREGKGTSWEGGVRTPFVAYWKNKIPANRRIDQPVMTIDLLPTIAAISSAALPAQKIDGIDISSVLLGRSGSIPDRPLFFYYNRNDLEAVRWKNWKLYFPHNYRTMQGQEEGADGKPGKYLPVKMTSIELYDLSADPYEKNNVAAMREDIVAIINALANEMREELGDDLQQKKGRANRPAGTIDK